MKGGNCFMNKNVIKIISFVATIIGMGASLVTDWANEKKLDDKIGEKVAETLAKKINKES